MKALANTIKLLTNIPPFIGSVELSPSHFHKSIWCNRSSQMFAKMKRFLSTSCRQRRTMWIVIVAILCVLFVLTLFSTTHYWHPQDSGKTRVLVFGGAGYIGSHVVRELLREGDAAPYEVLVFDDFSAGFRDALKAVEGIVGTRVRFVKGDINIYSNVESVIRKFQPEIVFHLCAKISVHESMVFPLRHYRNNIGGTVNILDAMRVHDVKKFVFSSTAAVFGTPDRVPIRSDDRLDPINPYGRTKLLVERMLKDCDAAWGLKYVALRYFNAAGADASGSIGESHSDESHLVPIVLQVALGQREKVLIFGDDYPTPDGTCLRDYIHVTDLAGAHLKALSYLLKEESESVCVNLGSGTGFSVKQIIDTCEEVTGKKIEFEVAERRIGDPPELIASSEKAERVLGWERKYDNVTDIIASAYKWHLSHPNGFSE